MAEIPEGDENTTDTFERLLGAPRSAHYELQLYVSGLSPRSTIAIREITRICEHWLADSYSLQITDIYDEPMTARAHQVVASPTLIRHSPLPVRRLVGDMSNEALVLRTLDLA